MAKQNDILWKAVLEQLFEDFLRFINPELFKTLNLTHGFEFIDKEFNQQFPAENGVFIQKIIDILVKLYPLCHIYRIKYY